MATPTLATLRSSFPDSRITGVMSPLNRELLAGDGGECSYFDDEILFHKRRRKSKHKVSRLGIIPKLRRRSIDILVLLTNSWWTAAVAHWGGAKSIVGYDRDLRGYYLTEKLPVPMSEGKPIPISAIDYYLQVAGWIGADCHSRRMELPLTEADQLGADELWKQVGFDSETPTIVINNNAAKDVSRVWPLHHVTELASKLSKEYGYQVLFHCGPGETAYAKEVVEQVADPLVASMGVLEKLPIGLSRGVLSRASVVVSTDSGARHMAVALGRPVVSLFGSTTPAWTKTYNVPEIELAEVQSCSPCYKPKCPLKHHDCMQKLSVNRVVEAVNDQLKHVNAENTRTAEHSQDSTGSAA